MDKKKLEELMKRALKADPAMIGHYVTGGFMSVDIKPISDDMRVIGPAHTVRLPTNDNGYMYYAIKRAPKGSVLVIDRMGERRYGCVGELVVRTAMQYGIAGIIVDGPSTDTKAIRELGFPVFSTGRSAATNILRSPDGEYNVTINCGGAVVNPGDIVYGDLDGVVVAPPDRFEELVAKAEEAVAREEFMRDQFAKGKVFEDFENIDRFVEETPAKAVRELLKVN